MYAYAGCSPVLKRRSNEVKNIDAGKEMKSFEEKLDDKLIK